MDKADHTRREVSLEHMEDIMPLIREGLSAGRSVKIAPRGVSMLPMIRQGKDEVILAPPPPELKKYDIALYQRENGKYILHRVVRIGESYTFIGDNQFVYEHGISHERVIAVVAGFTRGGKPKSVRSLSYKLYCRLWHLSRYPRRKLLGLKRRISALFEKGKDRK